MTEGHKTRLGTYQNINMTNLKNILYKPIYVTSNIHNAINLIILHGILTNISKLLYIMKMQLISHSQSKPRGIKPEEVSFLFAIFKFISRQRVFPGGEKEGALMP